ncbi:MAG: protein-L-isoaspartate O-methyltransferase [Candidatus Nanoarchaeia archaeon]|nr:protein-L-isoaspartate O-methyltransferase [Candidatus Nanoarchaeia archaeon]MDD5053837.1 protein-L-isoaspartate O-methyltransferase [Candidatus Nanoarchaeia archaeon]MDD5499656.1 protein-L-isoaspartate O-methyltransferase [Candidatus Nanoarchaeia archaeon]
MSTKKAMLESLKNGNLIKNSNILKAFNKIKREDFLPDYLKDLAYADAPLPISKTESMNQISTTLFFIDALNLNSGHTVLEVGAGSGYSTAILSEIVGKTGNVVSFELDKELHEKAKKNLKKYSNVTLVLGNGLKGFPDKAPYDRAILFGALEKNPEAIMNQLKVGGVLVYPKGSILQSLVRIKKLQKGLKSESLGEYRLSKLIN